MFEYLSQAFITLFIIIDPIAVLPVFVALTRNDTAAHRREIALRSTLIATAVLLVFAFVGEMLLDKLGITEPAFKIAGGLLLLLTAIDMVVAKHSGISSTTKDEDAEASHKADISVFPLAIPLIAGPGTLTTVIMLMRNADSVTMEFGVILMLILVILINYIFLRVADPVTRLLGVTGTNVVSRILGIILAGLAIQFVLTGLSDTVLNFMKVA
jgi:multiple antibiotic resistance protein